MSMNVVLIFISNLSQFHINDPNFYLIKGIRMNKTQNTK